jgi:hypothetical protein
MSQYIAPDLSPRLTYGDIELLFELGNQRPSVTHSLIFLKTPGRRDFSKKDGTLNLKKNYEGMLHVGIYMDMTEKSWYMNISPPRTFLLFNVCVYRQEVFSSDSSPPDKFVVGEGDSKSLGNSSTDREEHNSKRSNLILLGIDQVTWILPTTV